MYSYSYLLVLVIYLRVRYGRVVPVVSSKFALVSDYPYGRVVGVLAYKYENMSLMQTAPYSNVVESSFYCFFVRFRFTQCNKKNRITRRDHINFSTVPYEYE